ncbi:MAG: hypothetical protein SRB2_02050 [Desulfobacteraceae bacterium Eth-SRB2]|nr:MAG: hypothetical protein SRB2_02050 [Desulfobacteraceae bacterium Eth-SRB2]
MDTIPVPLRNKLERTIIQARDVAEAGAKVALEALAVHYHEPYGHMSPEERKLRNHLRARARQLGDKQNRKGELEITHLVWECAYEHWHRMLFARFLAENTLLIEPEMGVAISLEECEELAKDDGKDLWTLASEFAQHMLPQIFRPNDPVLHVTFASEHRLKLEKFLNDLEPAIFTASDSLGWVYQFWQSKRKKEVNQSGKKIGADELPAVTQLFTEPYMVSFLLDNSLGAWWAARRLTENDLKNAENEEELRSKASLTGMPLEYLRFVKLNNGTWTPAAGTFDGWPEHLSELKTLDPCCGSGHFLVSAFLMLVPMRMELEGLSARDACDAVLRENLYGLEIDNRCVELAAFALALTAWTYPDTGGYRPLPELNLACSGLVISAKKEEWFALAGDNNNLRIALEELYKQFKDAPVLGSLINPEIGLSKGSLFELKWEEVGPLLTKALSGERDDERNEMGVVAQGIVKASAILASKYDFLATNVPYKKTGEMIEKVDSFLTLKYPNARRSLETSFLARCTEFLSKGGTCSVVLPQNWLFLGGYKEFRRNLLTTYEWLSIARLGAGAFDTISGEHVKAILLTIKNNKLASSGNNKSSEMFFVDASAEKSCDLKAQQLKNVAVSFILQQRQLLNPDQRIILGQDIEGSLLSDFASGVHGTNTKDSLRFIRNYWERPLPNDNWEYGQTTVENVRYFGGLSTIYHWEKGEGELKRLSKQGKAILAGGLAWGKTGVCVRQVGHLPCAIYVGVKFDQNCAAIIPTDENQLPAIWCFCSSESFNDVVREIDQSLKVTNSTLVKVPFDLDHWTKIAEEKYPKVLPKPYSNDPTQWIFHGHPARSDDPLEVAVARLLGYRWPAELDAGMEIADEQREWVNKCDGLLKYVDEDGIVSIPSVRGEETADGRLFKLLSAAYENGRGFQPLETQRQDAAATLPTTAYLDVWLRDHFFEQHCKLFQHRPFIWHIWDGRRRDGFHALVNYHKLAEGNGKGWQLLESLTYSYLGDWITRQKEGVKRGEGGAEDRLAAALELQKRLIEIIEGEPPFDIFVRWKPIEKQPIGWEPDINDGVRLNIRPFMAQDIPGGRKGAGVLRWKPNIKWNKDRGKEPFRQQEQYPWFWKDGEFTGDRVNDIHLKNEEKKKAREV